MRGAGRIATREMLLRCIWDDEGLFIDDNTLSVHISRLRDKNWRASYTHSAGSWISMGGLMYELAPAAAGVLLAIAIALAARLIMYRREIARLSRQLREFCDDAQHAAVHSACATTHSPNSKTAWRNLNPSSSSASNSAQLKAITARG